MREVCQKRKGKKELAQEVLKRFSSGGVMRDNWVQKRGRNGIEKGPGGGEKENVRIFRVETYEGKGWGRREKKDGPMTVPWPGEKGGCGREIGGHRAQRKEILYFKNLGAKKDAG